MRRKIFIVLTVIWMALIFCMSNRDGNESSNDSYKIGYQVCKILVKDFESKSLEERIVIAKSIDKPIRKLAHASEYAILAILVVNSDEKNRFTVGLLVTFLYACSDEFHQLFVVGRNGNIIDVLIDTSGATIGLLVNQLLSKFHKMKA